MFYINFNLYICRVKQTNNLKPTIMKTYTTYVNGKKATQANNKKEAAVKLGVKQNNVLLSCVHIDFIQNCEKI